MKSPYKLILGIAAGVAAIFLLTATVGSYQSYGRTGRLPPQAQGPGVQGIDLSHHNPEPDYDHLEIQFAFLKATEGTSFQDNAFRRRSKKLRDRGIAVGAYHFFRGIDGRREYQNFHSAIDGHIDIVPVIDAERFFNVSPDKYRHELQIFIDCLLEHYDRFIIYSSADFYSRHIKDLPAVDGRAIFWSGDVDIDYDRLRPAPHIHQYTIGRTPGLTVPVDLNRLYLPLDSLLLPTNP